MLHPMSNNWFILFTVFAAMVLVPAILPGVVQQAWAQKSPVGLEDISYTRKVMDIAIAPNGKRIAHIISLPRQVYVDDDGHNWRELYVINRRGKLQPVVTGSAVAAGIRWQRDSEKLWFLAKFVRQKHTAIFNWDIDDKDISEVLKIDRDIRGFDIVDSGKTLLYWASEDNQQARQQLNIKGFNARVVDEDTPSSQLWLANKNDSGYQARNIPLQGHLTFASFAPDGKRILTKTAPSANVEDVLLRQQMQVIDLQGKTLMSIPHNGKLGRALWSPKGRYIAIVGTNDISNPAAGQLFLADTRSQSFKLLLTDFPGHIKDISWISESEIGFVADIGVDSILARKKVATVSDKYRTLIRDEGIHKKITFSRSGNSAAVITHKPHHPADLYWYQDKKLSRATDYNGWLRSRKLAQQQSLQHPSRDGLTLSGIYVAPLVPPATPPPVIFFVHGGPEAHVSNGWLERYSHPAHYAASLGFASFFPNYRGSTGRGVGFTKLGQGDYLGAEFNDLLDAREFLIEQGLAAEGKVGITGASYGGYFAAWAATAHSELFAASVPTMGIGNQVSKFGTTDIPAEMYHQHALQWPWQDWQWMLQRSPILYAAKSRTPTLLMHGQMDPRVHYSQSMELYRYLKMQSKAPVRLVLYPNEGHGLTRTASQLDYASRLMRWMQHFVLEGGTDLPPYTLTHQQRIAELSQPQQSETQDSIAESERPN